MVQLTVLYNKTADDAAFSRYYFETHVPLAKKIPGLRDYTVSDGAVNMVDGSPSPYVLIADLTFDSMAALRAALASPEGAAAAGDLGNFAHGGVALVAYERTSV